MGFFTYAPIRIAEQEHHALHHDDCRRLTNAAPRICVVESSSDMFLLFRSVKFVQYFLRLITLRWMSNHPLGMSIHLWFERVAIALFRDRALERAVFVPEMRAMPRFAFVDGGCGDGGDHRSIRTPQRRARRTWDDLSFYDRLSKVPYPTEYCGAPIRITLPCGSPRR